MTINIIIPVFNRINQTKKIIANLRAQKTSEKIKILIIDDGSTDGTSNWLSLQNDLFFLKGNGKLLWGGAVNLGVNYIIKNYPDDEWILLINNDVEVKTNYLESLLKIAKENYPAAVGSIIKKINHNKVVSIGPKIFPKKLKVLDLINQKVEIKNNEFINNVDALSGRGVLYPISSLIETKGLRPKLFPHYLADYELSLRVKKKGYKLIISTKSIVYTDEDFDLVTKKRKKEKIITKLFSRKSPSLIYANFFFWWRLSKHQEKLCLPFRIIVLNILSAFKKNL